MTATPSQVSRILNLSSESMCRGLSNDAIDNPARTLFDAFDRLDGINPPNFADAQLEALIKPKEAQKPLWEVGAGSCGRIYQLPGTNAVLKRAKAGQEDSLWNDYRMHIRIRHAFRLVGADVDVCIPSTHFFVGKEDTGYWKTYDRIFSTEAQEMPHYVLQSERIPPLPKHLREALLHLFCPKDQRIQAIFKPENRDCLVKVCLGETDVANEASKSVLRKGESLRSHCKTCDFIV